eukprot:7196056-Prymnesium_polylepis.1
MENGDKGGRAEPEAPVSFVGDPRRSSSLESAVASAASAEAARATAASRAAAASWAITVCCSTIACKSKWNRGGCAGGERRLSRVQGTHVGFLRFRPQHPLTVDAGLDGWTGCTGRVINLASLLRACRGQYGRALELIDPFSPIFSLFDRKVQYLGVVGACLSVAYVWRDRERKLLLRRHPPKGQASLAACRL